VPELAAAALRAIYPDGPAWPGQRAKAVAAWEAYLQQRGAPTRHVLSPEETRKVSDWLLARAARHARPVDPARAIGCLLRSRRLLGDRAPADIGPKLLRLTRAETQALADAVLEASQRNRGEYPDPQVPLPKSLEAVYDFDPLRLTEAVYLDAWGRPYRYVRLAREGAAPFEVYSVGPNGKDEGGKGDDIVSGQKP
jgi:hypothetical protein